MVKLTTEMGYLLYIPWFTKKQMYKLIENVCIYFKIDTPTMLVRLYGSEKDYSPIKSAYNLLKQNNVTPRELNILLKDVC